MPKQVRYITKAQARAVHGQLLRMAIRLARVSYTDASMADKLGVGHEVREAERVLRAAAKKLRIEMGL